MSETLRDLVVSLSLQTDNFTRNIKSVNKQIQETEFFFKLAAVGVENFEHTAQGLSDHLSTLQQRLSLQREVVDQYGKALDAARSKLSECYARQGEYAQRLATVGIRDVDSSVTGLSEQLTLRSSCPFGDGADSRRDRPDQRAASHGQFCVDGPWRCL